MDYIAFRAINSALFLTQISILSIIMGSGRAYVRWMKGAIEVMSDELDRAIESLKSKVQEALDKTDIDEKIVEGAKGLKGKVQEVLDKTDIDEKIVGAVKSVPGKVQEVLDKTDIDEKIVDGAKGVIDRIGSALSGKNKE